MNNDHELVSHGRDRRLTGADVQKALSGFWFSSSGESQLQVAVAIALGESRILFQREVDLGEAGRIDFLLDNGIGLELKVRGSAGNIAAQLSRYASSPQIRELVLVTTRHIHCQLPDSIGGKPLAVLVLTGGGFGSL